MRVCSIASGSSGNCIYVGTERTHLLIDAGCSKKKITEGLHDLDLSLEDIDAILVTHEHSDLTAGLKTILKAADIPVYATEGTYAALGLTPPHAIRAEEPFTVGDFAAHPSAISHDAAEPVCFRLTAGDKVFAMATGLGIYDDNTVRHLSKADVLLLEANHDIRMLQTGPYPYPLKQRILGDRGHLSNDASGALLSALLHDNLRAVMLGHLSERNNLPELAYETVRLEVEMGDTPYHASDFLLRVCKRGTPSPCIAV